MTDSSAESSAGVVWHQLEPRDPDTAAMNDSALFDWSFTEKVDLGQLRHQRFAFGAGESSSGLISDVEGRLGVHTPWLFFFSVPSLDVAVGRVRRHGGIVIGPIALDALARPQAPRRGTPKATGTRLGAARDGLAGRSEPRRTGLTPAKT
ncbi:hypothetical protein WME98_37060 [Sorangium sp. So ce296]|uniref:hypothetical protein n=1 Tax=Sorangium sp. So ce296 TaxID=3133296 RepID=UPI003F5F8A6C